MWPGDVFILRVNGSRPYIWQWGPQVNRVLFPIPKEFMDHYGVVQEWEKNTYHEGYRLRLDFLRWLQLPSSDHQNTAVNFDRFKAALNKASHPNLNREVQLYRTVQRVYTLPQSLNLLFKFGFFRSKNEVTVAPPVSPVLRVQVDELLDQLPSIPANQLSDTALRDLQGIQNRRHHQKRLQGISYTTIY